MKSARDKVAEKIMQLECLDDILKNVEWRIDGAITELWNVNTKIEEYAELHGGDMRGCCLFDERERVKIKIIAYQDIEKVLENEIKQSREE